MGTDWGVIETDWGVMGTDWESHLLEILVSRRPFHRYSLAVERCAMILAPIGFLESVVNMAALSS